MADLSLANSAYATGGTDTWSSQVNNVSLHDAQHVNGLASAILQIEAALGSGSSLPGSLSSLAARLAVQVGADGIIIPPGAASIYFGASAPTGWLFCDGSAVSRTTYAALFTAIGTTWGVGNGTTTFNLPDLRGRIPMGSGSGTRDGESGSGVITGGTALSSRSLGAWGGAESVALAEANNGPHTHTFTTAADGSGAGSLIGQFYDNTPSTSQTTSSSGSGTPHANVQPFLVVNVIIKI
jgi:microcystin-dependent protein